MALGELTKQLAQQALGNQIKDVLDAKPAGPAYKQPMTSWGEPDISGMWPINHLVSTRLERDTKYGDRAFLTDEEFKAAQRNRLVALCRQAGIARPELLADELFLLLEGARVSAQSVGPEGPAARLVRMGETTIANHTRRAR